MKVRLLILAAATLLLAADKADDARKELDKLQGTWTVVSLESGGKANANATGDTFTIDGDRFSIKTKREEMKGTLKLDATKSPKVIDLQVTEGNQKGTALGVYSMEGDELKLSLAAPGVKERPTELKSKEGTLYLYVVLKREKK